MWLLALETTTREGSVALLEDDVVVTERTGDPALSHAERLPADFAAVLAEAGLTLGAIDLFAVATGPGGFDFSAELREGLAVAVEVSKASEYRLGGIDRLACDRAARGDEHWRKDRIHGLLLGAATNGEMRAVVAIGARPAAIEQVEYEIGHREFIAKTLY